MLARISVETLKPVVCPSYLHGEEKKERERKKVWSVFAGGVGCSVHGVVKPVLGYLQTTTSNDGRTIPGKLGEIWQSEEVKVGGPFFPR